MSNYWKYFLQSGGGSCSLCGAAGVTKTTCPFNTAVKNPQPSKHSSTPLEKSKKSPPKKQASPKKSPSKKQASPKKSPSTRKSPVKPSEQIDNNLNEIYWILEGVIDNDEPSDVFEKKVDLIMDRDVYFLPKKDTDTLTQKVLKELMLPIQEIEAPSVEDRLRADRIGYVLSNLNLMREKSNKPKQTPWESLKSTVPKNNPYSTDIEYLLRRGF